MGQLWGRPSDPTPFEIAIATAKIRMTWSEAEHRERSGMAVIRRWEPPLSHMARFEQMLAESAGRFEG